MVTDKLEFLNGMKEELSKKNKFLTYNPMTESIIINGLISFSLNEINQGKYGSNLKDISKKLDKITDNMFYGWEHIKKGTVPKECNMNSLIPGLFSVTEIENTYSSFSQIMEANKVENNEENTKIYTPQILSNDQYGSLGVMFLYNLEHGRFPLTIKQYEVLSGSMDFENFMIKMYKNSRERFKEEIKHLSKDNGIVNNCYLWNLNKSISRSVVLGAELLFEDLIKITGFYADRIYLYPFSEYQFALFHGLIDGNDLLSQISVLHQMQKNPIDLQVFEINSQFTSVLRFSVGTTGPISQA